MKCQELKVRNKTIHVVLQQKCQQMLLPMCLWQILDEKNHFGMRVRRRGEGESSSRESSNAKQEDTGAKGSCISWQALLQRWQKQRL